MHHIFYRSRRILALLVLLSVSLCAACSSGVSTGSPPQQTRSCPGSAQPQITALTSVQTQAESIYFTSSTDLYAFNAGDGAFRWCVGAQDVTGKADQGKTLSELGSLTFHNGYLYVNAYNGYLDTFSAASGSLLWQYPAHADALGMNPTVIDGTVYSGSSILYALNAQSGNLRWQYAMEGAGGAPVTPTALSWGNPSSSSPIVANGIVYVRSTFSPNQTQTFGYLHALDATTGQKQWVMAAPPCSGICLLGNPLVEQNRVLVPTNDGVMALDAQTGHTLWQWQDPGHNVLLLGGTNNRLYVVEETIYTNGQPVNHPRMYALDSARGASLWSVAALDDALRLRTLATSDLVYVAAAGTLYAYNAQDGSVRWRTQLAQGGGVSMTGPFLLNNELYIGEEGETTNGTVLLRALNAQSGVENWYATMPALKIGGQMDIAGG